MTISNNSTGSCARRGIISLIVLVAAIFAGSMNGNAQEVLSKKEGGKVLENIAKTYPDWQTASWQGSLKSDMLPLSIKMRVYMEKDQLTLISLRVPLMGEVARVEIDNDSLLVVNKMKRVYCVKPIGSVLTEMPGLVESLQSLLLGRVTVIGEGEVSKKMADSVTVISVEPAAWRIIPEIPDDFSGVNYEYLVVTDDMRMKNFMVAASEGESASTKSQNPADADDAKTTGRTDGKGEESLSLSVDLEYPNPLKGDVTAYISMAGQKMNMSVTLETEPISYNVKKTERINLPKGYRRVSMRDCMKF